MYLFPQLGRQYIGVASGVLQEGQCNMYYYIVHSLITGAALVALDSYFYGRLIVTPWEFVKFNVLHDIASFYGTHPW